MKLVIDRNVWLRGEGASDSFLLRESDNKMCCVGIYLKKCGLPDAVLVEELTANGVYAVLPKQAEWLINDPDDEVEVLYTTNDDIQIDNFEREEILSGLFKAKGIDVEFIN